MGRKCTLCKKDYSYCPNCTKDKSKPTWHRLFCCENCRNIFNALNQYNFKLISKEETQSLLRKCDLSKVDELSEHYRNEINAIMTEPEAPAVEAEPVIKQRRHKKEEEIFNEIAE